MCQNTHTHPPGEKCGGGLEEAHLAAYGDDAAVIRDKLA